MKDELALVVVVFKINHRVGSDLYQCLKATYAVDSILHSVFFIAAY